MDSTSPLTLVGMVVGLFLLLIVGGFGAQAVRAVRGRREREKSD